MKIVLVQPKSFHTWEALNCGYLASILKANGFSDVTFYSGFFDDDRTILEGCRGADLVGFSCTSPQFRHGLDLARNVRKQNPGVRIVFGGFHASAVPDDVLENDCIDQVVTGEGEFAFLAIANGNHEPKVRVENTKQLDEIPFPDRQVIKQERNLARAEKLHGQRVAGMFSTRGCPFTCVFCASHIVWGRRHRWRSPENIVDEFEQTVQDTRADYITFADDEMGINKKQLIEMCELMVRRGNKVPWGCNVVASTLSDDVLKAMWAAGCKDLWIGVESGSPEIMKQVQKPITVDIVKSAFKRAKEIGFNRRAYFLLGMPNEGWQDIQATERLVEDIQPDVVGFTILAPYPGTKFYDPVKHKDMDWSGVDEYQNRTTVTRELSNEDLRHEQARLVEKFQKMIAFRQKNVPQEPELLPGRSGF